MKLDDISEGKTKSQESTVKHLDVVEEVTTLVPSKQKRRSSQLQISRDAQELNPHATEDDIACAVEDETGCKVDSEQSDTQDTPTSANSMTSGNIARSVQMGRLSRNSVETNSSLNEIARQMTSMLSQMSSRFGPAPIRVSLLTHTHNVPNVLDVKCHSIRLSVFVWHVV